MDDAMHWYQCLALELAWQQELAWKIGNQGMRQLGNEWQQVAEKKMIGCHIKHVASGLANNGPANLQGRASTGA